MPYESDTSDEVSGGNMSSMLELAFIIVFTLNKLWVFLNPAP